MFIFLAKIYLLVENSLVSILKKKLLYPMRVYRILADVILHLDVGVSKRHVLYTSNHRIQEKRSSD